LNWAHTIKREHSDCGSGDKQLFQSNTRSGEPLNDLQVAIKETKIYSKDFVLLG